ncbi:MAG TPA: Crp/Fnr family transcriptional regulator [Sphingomonadaceae bacterium]|nr:Crp/Fnr family transcriptional regulator [Sphingomonadaceae bacterium]
MIDQSSVRNRLLAALSADDFARLAPHLQPATVERGDVLAALDAPIRFGWFLESAVGSIIAVSPDGHRVEAALFGRDGFGPASLARGVDREPFEILIQMPGAGFRIEAAALRDVLPRAPSLRTLLDLYLQALSTQTGYTALSNAVHQIDERCARWLLMMHDRVDGDDIQLTHEFLSLMLAVRRPSVTTALHVLEGRGLIRAERGWVTVRDRAGLEAFAADAYGRSETEYRRLLGAMG